MSSITIESSARDLFNEWSFIKINNLNKRSILETSLIDAYLSIYPSLDHFKDSGGRLEINGLIYELLDEEMKKEFSSILKDKESKRLKLNAKKYVQRIRTDFEVNITCIIINNTIHIQLRAKYL